MVGPKAAPNVVDHTSIPMARARRSSGARSAEANRAAKLVALPAPMPMIPTTNSG